jgi:hypothetical protein
MNPALIASNDPAKESFIVRGDLTKFSAQVNAPLLLFCCLDPGHKFGCVTVHAQFFRQNLLACTKNNHLLINVANGPTSLLTDEVLNSCNSFMTSATLFLPVCSLSSTDVRPVLK